jgi:RNA polymerase sigma factor (TIGR02999 family)
MTGEITRQLIAARGGDRQAFDALLPLVYESLRRLAGTRLRAERSDISLSPTDLVHEAYLKLVRLDRVEWQDRAHFFALAARAMRRILVDHARRRTMQKRGGDLVRVTLDERMRPYEIRIERLIALDRALERLERDNERRARVVECRFFAGMSVEETAAALDISPASVKREWAVARARLNRELATGQEAEADQEGA